MSAGPVLRDACALLARAGLARCEVKARESAACRNGQTRFPAYDVFAREPGAKRGRHVFTIVYLETQA